MLSAHLAQEPSLLARFVDEARAANQIRHRNVIDVFQFGQLPDGRPYQIMEYLEGETLAQYLAREGRLPTEAALPLFRAVARALDLVHDAGIVHRDLKPDNVFLTLDDDGGCLPKLLDFGIAKVAPAPPSARRTRTGVAMGTPSYMSPEQCRGLHVDGRSDIYAFGILIFEVLTGRPPFIGESLLDVMNAHLQEAPPTLRSLMLDVPVEFESVVASALAKDMESRPGRASALMVALDAAARAAGRGGSEEITHPPLRVQKTLHSLPVRSPAKLSPIMPLAPPPPNGARRWRAAGLLTATVAAGLAIAGFTRGAQSQPGPPVAPVAVAAQPAPSIPAPEPMPTLAAPPPPPSPRVHITIHTGPVKGAVFWGDAQLGTTGQVLELPRGAAPITLDVKSPGHTSAVVSLVPDRDRDVDVTLSRPLPPHRAAAVPQALEDPFAKP